MKKMLAIGIIVFSVFFQSCTTSTKLTVPPRTQILTGSEFYQKAAAMDWRKRDSLVWEAFTNGNVPDFLKKLVPITVKAQDSISGKINTITYYVTPDYFSIGTNADWARVNITPQTAQNIADKLGCFLPTPKMVDDIYQAAKVKLEPVPMYAFRDSTPTMWHHHLIIEGQRQGRKGLIAGIKKDVVLTNQLITTDLKNRVAIYGWHRLNGKAIQPVYIKHIYYWVDYSQSLRLVYRKVKVNGNWMDYTEVLENSTLKPLLSNEPGPNFLRYEPVK